MLILILVDVQFHRKLVFSFEKRSGLSKSRLFIHQVKKFPQLNFWFAGGAGGGGIYNPHPLHRPLYSVQLFPAYTTKSIWSYNSIYKHKQIWQVAS